MKIILQEKVRNLGNIGELVSVKPGYARNYLLPTRKAVLATPENKAHFEARRAELEKLAIQALHDAQSRAAALEKLTVTMTAKAGDEGKLFGSIGAQMLATAITAAGVSVNKNEIYLPNGVLRQVGEYDILVQLHNDVNVKVKVIVTPEV